MDPIEPEILRVAQKAARFAVHKGTMVKQRKDAAHALHKIHGERHAVAVPYTLQMMDDDNAVIEKLEFTHPKTASAPELLPPQLPFPPVDISISHFSPPFRQGLDD